MLEEKLSFHQEEQIRLHKQMLKLTVDQEGTLHRLEMAQLRERHWALRQVDRALRRMLMGDRMEALSHTVMTWRFAMEHSITQASARGDD